MSGCTSPDQPSSPTISSHPLQTQLREGSLSVPALSDLHHHHHHQAPKTRTLRSVLPTVQCVQLQAAVRLYCLQAGMACHLLISYWQRLEWWVILKSEGGVGKYNKFYLRNVFQSSRMDSNAGKCGRLLFKEICGPSSADPGRLSEIIDPVTLLAH